MTLNEILSLNKTKASINKIDLFLSTSVKNSIEYVKALVFKASIFVELKNPNDALKLLYAYIPDFSKMENESVILICDEIIDICIKFERYDQVFKFISIKKSYLPISKNSIFLKDQIRLYLAMNDYSKAEAIIKKYLEDDLEYNEEMQAKSSLAKIYFDNKNYQGYLELYSQLEGYFTDNLMIEDVILLHFNKIKINYEQNNYIYVITECENFLTENSDNIRYSLLGAALLIKAYLKCNNVKKATIIESNYTDYAKEPYVSEAIEFCYASLELYNRLNSYISITEYNRRIKELQSVNIPQPVKAKKKVVKDEKIDLVIPKMEYKEIEEDISSRGMLNPKDFVKISDQQIVKNSSKAEIRVNEEIIKLEEIFKAINTIDSSVKFREVFRISMIELTKIFNIEEVYLLYFDRSYYGLHYKKERAYDKKIVLDDIKETINYASLINNTEAFYDKNDQTYDKNIVNNEIYDESVFAFSMPLESLSGPIGSIAFISHNYFLESENAYPTLKLLTSVLNYRLLMSIKDNEFERNNKMNYFIIDNMSMGIKEEINNLISFNDNAHEIIPLMDNITVDDYIYKIDNEYKTAYKSLHDSLFTEQKNAEIEYYININDEKKYIHESFYPLMVDDDLVIFSTIQDLTRIKAEKENLVDLAYKNPISHISTELKLNVDLANIINNDYFALAIFEVLDFKLYEDLYGYNFSNQLVYAIGLKLSDALSNNFKFSLYHLDRDRYVILLNDVSDKRVIYSNLIQIFNTVSKSLEELNKRVRIKFNCGCYKKSKNDKVIDNNIPINYALDALNDAKLMDGEVNHIAFYDNELSKLRFRENNLITTISEALDKNLLSLLYHQVVDLKKGNVYGYFIKLSLDNYEVDHETMYEVIERKGLRKEMDKYLLSKSFKELKMLKDELGGCFLMFLPVLNISVDDQFISFIKKQISFFKINPKFITFIFDKVNTKYVDILKSLGFMIATKNIFDIYYPNIDFLFYDYHNSTFESISDINQITKNRNIELILENINTKEEILMSKNASYNLVYGKYYKVTKRIKDIINDLKK